MTNIKEKLEFIENLINNNEFEKACIEFYKYIKELEINSDENLPSLYYKFALLLFENEFYEDCIVMLNKSYKSNYMKKEIKEFIFSAFITPNLTEFKEAYLNNTNNYSKSVKEFNITFPILEFDKLKLEFIPVSTNKYYIFDLINDTFDEVIDFSTENITSQNQPSPQDEFSDILLLDNYNLNNLINYINLAKSKKIYYLVSSPLKALSFFKLPHLVDILLNNIFIFTSTNALESYFKKETSIYLPKVIYDLENGDDKTYFNMISSILNNIHSYRLFPENRDFSNILLSICIPSWNRGHRALQNIQSLLTLNYDSEIEFVISNNGSDINVDGYNEIKSINDSRITYSEFDSNQGYLNNVCKVLNLAKGKFALLLSDEDSINFTVLPHYLYILQNNNNLGVIRSGTTNNYRNLPQLYKEAGINAFTTFFLSNNYMSGIIYNTKILRENHLIDIILDNSSKNISCSLYAHMWLDAFITFKGDFYQDSNILCIEGSAEVSEKEKAKNFTPTINDDLLAYQHYESRIEQHYGFIELLNLLPITSNDVLINCYLGICWKTNFLVYLVKERYLKHNFDWNKIYDEILNCCLDGISKLNITMNNDMLDKIKNLITKYNQDYRQI